MSEKKPSSRLTGRLCDNMTFAAKEAFKRLRTNIDVELEDKEGSCCSIGITSAQPSEGKSTISVNLSFSYAQMNKKVLLIDADMRRPSINAKLDLNLTPGLSGLLSTSNSISSSLQRYTAESGTGFDVLAAGGVIDNPSELLDSPRMKKLLGALANAYDVIVVDLPPVGAVTDAVGVSKYVDGMVVVLRENNCPRGVFSDCVEQLKHAKARILGFVMNGAMEGSGKRYQYNSYYK